jgi:glycosyltransferase involved in cell wall biosynthesis
MRIVLVDPLAYTPPYDHSLAQALGEKGHDVTLLTSRFPHGRAPEPDHYGREELFAPVSTRIFRRSPLRLAAKGLEYAPSVARLVRRIERIDPDVVHVQWLPRPELDLRWLRRVADDRPLVLTAHDVLPRRRRAQPVWPDVLETAERVIVHSHRAVEQLVELGLGRERIARIPHPVFEGEKLPPPEGRTLLFFGLIRDYKGLDVLLEALPEIPDASLVVAGDPVDPVPRNMDARVEWQLRFIEADEIPALMTRAAAVVLPYRRLDSSGVLATAIGYRRPVVVTDVGSLGEIVREFGAGEVVPVDDPHALAEACARLLEPKALAKAAKGAERAAKELTWERSGEAHDALYREVRR